MKGSDKTQTMFGVSAGRNFLENVCSKRQIKMFEDNIKMDFSEMCWDNGW
jgi:hypothetical protein